MRPPFAGVWSNAGAGTSFTIVGKLDFPGSEASLPFNEIFVYNGNAAARGIITIENDSRKRYLLLPKTATVIDREFVREISIVFDAAVAIGDVRVQVVTRRLTADELTAWEPLGGH